MSIATCAKATFEARSMAPKVNPNFICHPHAQSSAPIDERASVMPGNCGAGFARLGQKALPYTHPVKCKGQRGHSEAAQFLKRKPLRKTIMKLLSQIALVITLTVT